MSSAVHVQSIIALDDLKRALALFQSQVQPALPAIEQEIHRVEAWLQQRLNYWRAEVDRCQHAVRLAEAALAHCQASGSRDPRTGAMSQPNCRAQHLAVLEAQVHLRRAQEQFTIVQDQKRKVDHAITAYRVRLQPMTNMVSTHIPHAATFLGNRITELHAYLGSSSSGAGGQGSAPSSTAYPASGLPGAEPASGASGGRGVKGDIQMMSIDQINRDDSYVKGYTDFKKISPQDMIEGFRKLQNVVMPAVADGATDDDFARMDAQAGLADAQGYQHIYRVFFGNDAITLEKVGDQYQVMNGFHRLFIAQQLGITQVPVRIIASQP